jgi:hypothetical protein
LNSLFGRPTVTTSEDYDVDLPTECDDEYWGEPYNFEQPAGKPALTTFMTSYLKLMVIFNRAQRAIVQAYFFPMPSSVLTRFCSILPKDRKNLKLPLSLSSSMFNHLCVFF